jgi:hypothetical protein
MFQALLCIRKKKKKKLPYLNKIKFYLEMNALVDAIRSLSQKFYFSDEKHSFPPSKYFLKMSVVKTLSELLL